jgi:hypothetical protein
MTDVIAPQLDYAPAPPMSRPRRLARRAFAWLGLGVLVLAAAIYGPAMIRQAWYLRAQQRCLECTIPSTQLVYCNDPAAASQLLASGYKPVASAVGRSLASSANGASMSAGYVPPALSGVGEETLGYYANVGYGYIRQGVPNAPMRTSAFVHERRNAAVGQRLVAIIFLERQDSAFGTRRLEINALTWRPATWEPGSRLQLASLTSLIVPDIDHKRFRVFGGQADPSNPAHFTLAYDADCVPGTIDGFLDSYERVTLQFRDGPGTSWGTVGIGFGY